MTFNDVIYKHELSSTQLKCAMFQLIRGLHHLKKLNIVHRDIKPQNTLWDFQTASMKICDFGSAKKIVQDEESISYIGSRFYRAPELVLGSSFYGVEIDMWAVGCIFAEALLKKPLFFSKNNANLLYEIMMIIGSPSK